MKFLHPWSQVYGDIDAQAALISKTVRQRRMRVTSYLLKADFRSHGEHEQLHQLSGPDFRLVFARQQGDALSGEYDCAGLSEVVIPGRHLVLTQDVSRLRLYHYVGDRWEQDSNWFFAEPKRNSRKRGLARRTLLYTGSMSSRETGWRYSHTLPRFLVADSDDGHEHLAYEWDTPYWDTKVVLQDTAQWVQDNVLRALGIA